MASSPANNNTLTCALPGLKDSATTSSRYENTAQHHPTSEETMRETQSMLASEMSKLSFQERLEVLDDIHCVGKGLDETPERIQKALNEFENTLQRVGRNNQVYQIACRQTESCVRKPSFRLMFLRANIYDTEKAVRQMMSLLEYKARYFGLENVSRDITLDDLSEEEKAFFSRVWYIPNGLDRSGRVMVYVLSLPSWKYSFDQVIRPAYVFWIHRALQIPGAQEKGITHIYYDLSTPGKTSTFPSLDETMKFQNFIRTVPLRRTSHFLLKPSDHRTFDRLMSGVFAQLSPHTKSRISLQMGSDIELQYYLASRGVSYENCPVDRNGTVRDDMRAKSLHLKWPIDSSNLVQDLSDESNKIHVGKHAAATTAPRSTDAAIIREPTDHDILLGKGVINQRHTGNIRYRTFLKGYTDEYETLKRNQKTKFCSKMVQTLRDEGFRFLEQKSAGVWVETNNSKELETRVGEVFRYLRKVKKATGEGNG